MSISTAIFALVSATPAITAIIGTNPVRWYPQKLPQPPVYPVITYGIVDELETYAHSGFSGLVDTRLYLTLWGSTYLTVDNLASVVKAAMRAYRGTIGGTTIDRIFCVDHGTTYSIETQIHKRDIDLLIGYRIP